MTTTKKRSQQKFSPAGKQGSDNDWSNEFPKTDQEVDANNAETSKAHSDQAAVQQGPTRAQDTGDTNKRNPDAPLKSPSAYSHS